MTEENKMRKVRIEKLVLSISGIGDKLEKGIKLLSIITGRKAGRRKSVKRIPTLGVRPGLEIGCLVTIRGKEIFPLLKRLLEANDNKLSKRQIGKNSFSFGIAEYIEIPGIEYQREIGIIGLDVSVVFSRRGKRVEERKVKRGKIPKKQYVSKEEIIKFMEENFKTEIK